MHRLYEIYCEAQGPALGKRREDDHICTRNAVRFRDGCNSDLASLRLGSPDLNLVGEPDEHGGLRLRGHKNTEKQDILCMMCGAHVRRREVVE